MYRPTHARLPASSSDPVGSRRVAARLGTCCTGVAGAGCGDEVGVGAGVGSLRNRSAGPVGIVWLRDRCTKYVGIRAHQLLYDLAHLPVAVGTAPLQGFVGPRVVEGGQGHCGPAPERWSPAQCVQDRVEATWVADRAQCCHRSLLAQGVWVSRGQCRQAGDGAGRPCRQGELAQCPRSGFDDGVVGVVGGDEQGCSLLSEVGGGVVRNAPVRWRGRAASGSMGGSSVVRTSAGGTSHVSGGRDAGIRRATGGRAAGGSVGVVVVVSGSSCVAPGDRGAATPDAGITVGQCSGQRSGIPSAEPGERAEGRGAYRGIWIEAALGGSVLVAEVPGNGSVLPPGRRAVASSVPRLGLRPVARGMLRLGLRPVARSPLIRGRLCGAWAG